MNEVLKKGENIALFKVAPQLSEIIVAIKWLTKLNDATKFEIDSSAFLLTEQNKVRNDADFIFYNQPSSSDNSVLLKNTLFKINLNAIANDIHKLSFVLTLHDAKPKQQNFGMLDHLIIEVFNFADKQKIVSYTLNEMGSETALILGLLYRYNKEWKFKAIGQGYKDGLAILAKNFGVEIAEDSEQNNETQAETIPAENIKTTPVTTQEQHQGNLKPNSNQKSKSRKPKNKQTQEKQVNIHNTDFMTKKDHYQPILEWFKNKNFVTEISPDAMDTSGFFDEIAVELGDNYALLKIVSNTIKRRQLDKQTAYISLENYNLEQVNSLKKFCKQLYSYSFVAKYFYHSDKNQIILHLQSAIKIINFFNGEWLEWYAFMKVADFCHHKKINFSCTRNIIISLPDESKYELDVFCLIDGMPLFIECKSGEYRGFIDKYSRLRKKMLMDKSYFWFLISGETNEQVKGLTAMFDITFINEKMLADYCNGVFIKKNS